MSWRPALGLITVLLPFSATTSINNILFCVFSRQTRPVWTAGSQASATVLSRSMSSRAHMNTRTHRDHVLRLSRTILTKPLFPPVAGQALFHLIGFICIYHQFFLSAASQNEL